MKENRLRNILLFHMVVPLICFHACTREQSGSAPQLGKDPVKEVIAAMTLEEKAMVVVGAGAEPQLIPVLPEEHMTFPVLVFLPSF